MIPISNQASILPLSFPCCIMGIEQQATVIKDLSDIEAYRYRVKFSDGTEDNFTLVEGPETVVEPDDKTNRHYAGALVNDLYELSKIDTADNPFFFVYPATINGEPVNMWLMEEQPDPGEIDCVMVSYHRNLQFQLYLENGQSRFQVRELFNRPLSKEEQEIAKELAASLDSVKDVIRSQNGQ